MLETKPHRVGWEVTVVLFASKSFLLCGCDYLPVHNESRRRIVVVRRNTEDFHVVSQTTRGGLLDLFEMCDGVLVIAAIGPERSRVLGMSEGQRVKTTESDDDSSRSDNKTKDQNQDGTQK
jgi:hypothetical protein